MDFELAEELGVLLKNDQLPEAIALAESRLKNIEHSDFHKVLGRDLLHLTSGLVIYLLINIK